MPEITFGICGTAGRNDDAKRLSRKHFEAMVLVAEELINQCEQNHYKIDVICTGGAAWSDHVGVKLFLDKKVPKLKLFLPCEWDGCGFKDTGVQDPKTNPGGTANYYHRKFQTATRINSLSQLVIAKNEGAEFINGKGFHARNALVAKSDFLLACTFGDKHEVKDGGTAHTVQCYLDRVRKECIFDKSFHYDLSCGELFIGCTVPKTTDTYEYRKYGVKSIVKSLPSNKIPSYP